MANLPVICWDFSGETERTEFQREASARLVLINGTAEVPSDLQRLFDPVTHQVKICDLPAVPLSSTGQELFYHVITINTVGLSVSRITSQPPPSHAGTVK